MFKKIKKMHLIALLVLSLVFLHCTSILGYYYVPGFSFFSNISNASKMAMAAHKFIVPVTPKALSFFIPIEAAIIIAYILMVSKVGKKIVKVLTTPSAKGSSMKSNQRDYKKDLIIFAVGFAMTAYAGILFGAAWSPRVTLTQWVADFERFVFEEHHFIVGFTAKTPLVVMIFEFIFIIAFLLYFAKIQHPFAGEEYGNAKWQDAKTFSAAFANHETGDNIVTVNVGENTEIAPFKVNTKNYWLAEDVYVNIENKKTSNLNMLVVGPPGSGKSFRLARPILSQMCGSFLVTDPKGELSSQTAQFFIDNGYEVFVLNVESEDAMANSIHFNPFRYIHNESDIMSIAGILMKSTTKPGASSGDQFFEESAEVLLTCLLYYMHYHVPEEEQNWETFVKLLNSTVVKSEQGQIVNEEGGIMDLFIHANEEWKKTHGENETFPGYIDIEKYYSGAPETTSSIVASLDTHCRYMKLKCVQKLLSEDEIKIEDSFGYCKKTPTCSTGKRVLYICTSEDKRYFDWIPSMIYSLFFDCLYHLTAIDKSLHETLPQHLTFLMDEFANVTLPDSFVEKLSTMRSRNMSAIVIVQNLIQLKRKFPDHDMDHDLIGNMSIIDILGAPDMDSCEYLSKHFGKMTIRKQTSSDPAGFDMKGSSSKSEDVMEKDLLSPNDIFKLDKDGPCAIVVKGTDPIYQQKVQFQNSPFLKLLCRKDHPYIFERNDITDEEKEEFRREAVKMDEDNMLVFDANDEDRIKTVEDTFTSHGVKVTTLTAEDLNNISIAQRHQLMEEEQESEDLISALIESGKAYREEVSENEINLDDYDGAGCKTVGRLLNTGYTPKQIHALDSLICIGKTADEIGEYFNSSMAPEFIRNFAERLADEEKSMQNPV